MSEEARQPEEASAKEDLLAGSRQEPQPVRSALPARSPARRRLGHEAAPPLHLIKVTRALAAAGSFIAAIALIVIHTHASASIYPKLLLGLGLALLIALVLLQHRSQRQVVQLSGEFHRASQLAKLHSSVIASFAMAIDAKDQHTHGHTERVRETASLIGQEMGLSDDELQALETAAMLHDIGKLAVPDYILSKPDQLTEEEMKKVQTHTLVGAAILEPVQFPWPVIPTIRSHHEWHDGAGYPDGLAGDQIPLSARILAVADVYDALLSHRPYRPAMTVQEAIAFMRERSGTQFDPEVLNLCFRVLAAEQKNSRFGFIFDANALRRPQDSAGRQAIFMDIRQAHQELLALYEIVQTMGQSLNVQETLDLIISKTKRIIDFTTCVIFLRQPDDDQLMAVATSGAHAEALQDHRLPLGRGVSGAAAQSGKPSGLGVAAQEDLLLLLGPSAPCQTLTKALSAPLGADTQTIGALTLYRTQDHPFTEDDSRLLSAIARQATVAINNARQYEQTRQSALTDQLTGLHNARYFFTHLEQELSRARREKKPVSLIAIDLNNLKQINDNYGHQQGDRALRILAEVFKRDVRDYDTVVRYAGDEFFIILPDTTNQKALETVNRIKRAARDAIFEIAAGRRVSLSASFGVATFPGDAKEPDGLIAVADRAMYADKHLNRQAALLTAAEQARGQPAAAAAAVAAQGADSSETRPPRG